MKLFNVDSFYVLFVNQSPTLNNDHNFGLNDYQVNAWLLLLIHTLHKLIVLAGS